MKYYLRKVIITLIILITGFGESQVFSEEYNLIKSKSPFVLITKDFKLISEDSKPKKPEYNLVKNDKREQQEVNIRYYSQSCRRSSNISNWFKRIFRFKR
tara:strand:+ start:3292 stop:3591 length:300 start_codon:yes stop_codon:yes gene_type:complete